MCCLNFEFWRFRKLIFVPSSSSKSSSELISPGLKVSYPSSISDWNYETTLLLPLLDENPLILFFLWLLKSCTSCRFFGKVGVIGSCALLNPDTFNILGDAMTREGD